MEITEQNTGINEAESYYNVISSSLSVTLSLPSVMTCVDLLFGNDFFLWFVFVAVFLWW